MEMSSGRKAASSLRSRAHRLDDWASLRRQKAAVDHVHAYEADGRKKILASGDQI